MIFISFPINLYQNLEKKYFFNLLSNWLKILKMQWKSNVVPKKDKISANSYPIVKLNTLYDLCTLYDRFPINLRQNLGKKYFYDFYQIG